MGGRALLMLSFLLSLSLSLSLSPSKRQSQKGKECFGKEKSPDPYHVRTQHYQVEGGKERRISFGSYARNRRRRRMGHQEMGGLSFSLFFERCPPQVRAVRGMGIVIRVPAHYCRPAVGPKPKVQCEWGGAFLSKSTNPFGRLSTLPTTFCTHCEGPPTMPTNFFWRMGREHTPGIEIVFSPDCANTP